MTLRVRTVENLEDAGGEGDDAGEGGVWLWEKGAPEGVFVGRFAGSCNGRTTDVLVCMKVE